jgi:hypothetical protein
MRREAVLASLLDHCSHRNWIVLATHVRSSHVHRGRSEAGPEPIINDLKSYGSRCLNRMGLDPPARKRWARHGSTRWLSKAENVSAAVRYVVDEQGEPMSVFEASLS